jgi:monoamine oxidase
MTGALASAAWAVRAAPLPSDPDVAVIGAGSAGIAAARALIARGVTVAVIEAAERLGGRAFTESALFGAPYDHGCASLQGPPGLPHVALARDLGFTLHDHAGAEDILFVGGRRADAAERRAFDLAWARVTRALDRALGDVAAGSVVPRDDPMAAVVETWIGPMDHGVDLDDLSTRDWAGSAGPAYDYLVKEGLGTLVARLGTGLPVATATPATAVDWAGGGVRVETPRGTIAARACIVTVSTGVLASGAIRFAPALPGWKAAAIADVPMGCLAKIGLRFDGARLGLPENAYLAQAVAGPLPAEACCFLTFPTGHDYIVGHVGGRFGREVVREGTAAAVDFALATLAGMVGGETRRRFLAGHLSEWETNPLTLGAYSAARPGRFDARAELARPLGDRVFFAGEATAAPWMALCTGAHLSGERAAAEVAAALGPAPSCASCDARARRRAGWMGGGECSGTTRRPARPAATRASTSCSSRSASDRSRRRTASTRCRTATGWAGSGRRRWRPCARSRPRGAGRRSAPSRSRSTTRPS